MADIYLYTWGVDTEGKELRVMFMGPCNSIGQLSKGSGYTSWQVPNHMRRQIFESRIFVVIFMGEYLR